MSTEILKDEALRSAPIGSEPVDSSHQQTTELVWQRLLSGLHTAVIGDAAAICRSGRQGVASSPVRLVVQDCGVHPQPLGALAEVQRRLSVLLDGGSTAGGGGALGLLPGLDVAADRVLSGLRRRLMGELAEQTPLESFVQSLDKLALRSAATNQHWAIAFDRVERADADTLHLLKLVVARTPSIPLLLVFAGEPMSGPALELLQAVLRGCGDSSLVRLSGQPEAIVHPEVTNLPAQVLLVLRGLAIAGAGCELPVLAELLALTENAVLGCLQQAADAGVVLADDGDGHFELQPELASQLLAKTLPSVAKAYHRRLASLLSDRQAPRFRSAESQATPSAKTSPPDAADGIDSSPAPVLPAIAPSDGDAVVFEPATPAQALSEVLEPSSDQTPATEVVPDPSSPPSALPAEVPLIKQALSPILQWPYAAGSVSTAPAPIPAAETPEAAEPAVPVAAVKQPRAGRAARAARHLVEAGELDHGVERYLLAVEQALRVGAIREAMGLVERAMQLLSQLPQSEARRLLRIRALCFLGRIRWIGNGPDERFTLAGALKAYKLARSQLLPSDPSELRVQVSSQLAEVLYEIGDLPSLEEALHELAETSRTLLSQGDGVVAARLLNDQAAVYVRIGDPVRAAHLLEESRRFFSSGRFASDDDRAALELAETEHLLARLPLHVASRPGRERDAVALGRSHAQEALATYKRLGMRRELAHVFETLGRLETLAGRPEAALSQLSAAAKIERELQDLLGLARTTAAMADVLSGAGQLGGAVALLAESLALNVEKGSPIGLAFVRRSVERIAARAQQAGSEHSVEERRAVEQLLEQIGSAEKQLGQVRLPTDF